MIGRTSAVCNGQSTGKVISRKQALKAGERFYFTTLPCKRGHVAERYTKSRECVACMKCDSVKRRKRRVRKAWVQTPEGRAKHREYMRNFMHEVSMVGFGLTPDEYCDLWEEQGGVCWVCKQEDGDRRLAVDHCHQTGEVRHLLCRHCNMLEGNMKSLVQRGGVEAAKRFLTEYQSYWTQNSPQAAQDRP